MKARVWVLACATLFTSPRSVLAQCKDAAIHRSQEAAIFGAPEYSSQIQLARRAALEIYDHGMLGNSGSAVNNKIARPPGMSIAVAAYGKLVWAEGFGFADIEQCVPVVPKTKFRIGSTSKPLTAAGAALLYEQGRLDLGIRGYNDEENSKLDRDAYRSMSESLNRFKDDPLAAPPGSKWIYSTYGYVLVSAAIEKASGQDFLSFMHDKVFLPLGMQDTVADESDKIIPYRARWYTLIADGSYRNAPYEDLSYKWAGGGFLSTAEDLARFGASLSKSGFLKQDTLTMIFSPQKTIAGKKTKYGLGWFVHDGGGQDPERQFEHSGGVAGSSSWLVIFPDRGVVIAWVQNSNDFRDWPILNVAAPFFSSRK